jgi:RHS repeat-associated protein
LFNSVCKCHCCHSNIRIAVAGTRGQPYAGAGAKDLDFTGQDQDTVSGVYDFVYREYSPAQGRWISPDPAGMGAVNPANPQSWNRDAYLGNMPLNATDPIGLGAGCDPVYTAKGARPDPSCNGHEPGGMYSGNCEEFGVPINCNMISANSGAFIPCLTSGCSGLGTQWKLSSTGEDYMLNVDARTTYDPDDGDSGAIVKQAGWADLGSVTILDSVVTLDRSPSNNGTQSNSGKQQQPKPPKPLQPEHDFVHPTSAECQTILRDVAVWSGGAAYFWRQAAENPYAGPLAVSLAVGGSTEAVYTMLFCH